MHPPALGSVPSRNESDGEGKKALLLVVVWGALLNSLSVRGS